MFRPKKWREFVQPTLLEFFPSFVLNFVTPCGVCLSSHSSTSVTRITWPEPSTWSQRVASGVVTRLVTSHLPSLSGTPDQSTKRVLLSPKFPFFPSTLAGQHPLLHCYCSGGMSNGMRLRLAIQVETGSSPLRVSKVQPEQPRPFCWQA